MWIAITGTLKVGRSFKVTTLALVSNGLGHPIQWERCSAGETEARAKAENTFQVHIIQEVNDSHKTHHAFWTCRQYIKEFFRNKFLDSLGQIF